MSRSQGRLLCRGVEGEVELDNLTDRPRVACRIGFPRGLIVQMPTGASNVCPGKLRTTTDNPLTQSQNRLRQDEAVDGPRTRDP